MPICNRPQKGTVGGNELKELFSGKSAKCRHSAHLSFSRQPYRHSRNFDTRVVHIQVPNPCYFAVWQDASEQFYGDTTDVKKCIASLAKRNPRL